MHRVPARLTAGLSIVHFQRFDFPQRLHHKRMVNVVAEAAKGHKRVRHRRINCTQPATAV